MHDARAVWSIFRYIMETKWIVVFQPWPPNISNSFQNDIKLGCIHNLSGGWAMMIFFSDPPPSRNVDSSKENIIAPHPPAHNYNMSNSPLAISNSCDRLLSFISNWHNKSVTTCTNEMVILQDVNLWKYNHYIFILNFELKNVNFEFWIKNV